MRMYFHEQCQNMNNYNVNQSTLSECAYFFTFDELFSSDFLLLSFLLLFSRIT